MNLRLAQLDQSEHRVLPVVYEEMEKYFAVQTFRRNLCLRCIDVRYGLGCRFHRCYYSGCFD